MLSDDHASVLPPFAARFFRRFRRANQLAVPFIADDGTGEDDYAMLPPPKPIKSLQLMALTFFAVSGSAFGIEETVSAGGPLLALLMITLAALVWSLPLALVACELSIAMPHSGGYIVWVHNAFGPLPSLLNGLANLLCNVFDCALYPLILTDYLQRAILPLLPPEPHGGGSAWWRLAPTFLGTFLRLLLVLVAALVNVLGANVVGVAAGVFMLAVTIPFAWLTVSAYSSPSAQPAAPFTPSLQNWPSSYAQFYFLLQLVLWNTCGYDSAGMVAAEVVDGRTTFPRALGGALVLTTASYLLPLAACASADQTWPMWGEGQFENLGQEFGGTALGAALLVASIVSMVGVMCTLLMTSSRAISAMAQLRMLPAPLARLHPLTGAPHFAIGVNACLISAATALLRLEALVELSMFFYSINAIVQCAAVTRLRVTHPHRLRPRHILPTPLLALPVGVAATTLLLSPWRNWLGALSLIAATLVTYALIHLGRFASGRPTLGAPPSARAAAAVDHLARVAEPSADDIAFERVQTEDNDAWFRNLLGGARQARQREQAVAAEVVQAFELTQLESASEPWTRDVHQHDEEEPEAPPKPSAPPEGEAPPPSANTSAGADGTRDEQSGDGQLTEVRLDDDAEEDGAAAVRVGADPNEIIE